jgi:sugar phosphate permease
MVMRVPGVLPLGVAYFFIKTVRYILLFWLPYYLHVQQGFAVPVAGYLSTVFDLGSIVGAVSLGWLTDRFARRQRTVVTTLTAVALGVNLLFFDAIAALGVLPCGLALALLGMLVAGPDSSIPGAAVQDVMERAGGVGARGVGTAVGLVQGMGSIGTATQGFLVSAIVAHGGWQGLFPSLVVLCVSASLVLLPTVAREAKVL